MRSAIQIVWRTKFWREENGQDLVEYALLVALVAVAAVAFIPGLTSSIQAVFNNIAETLSGATGG